MKINGLMFGTDEDTDFLPIIPINENESGNLNGTTNSVSNLSTADGSTSTVERVPSTLIK